MLQNTLELYYRCWVKTKNPKSVYLGFVVYYYNLLIKKEDDAANKEIKKPIKFITNNRLIRGATNFTDYYLYRLKVPVSFSSVSTEIGRAHV